VFTVPNDRIFVLTHANHRIQLTGGLPAFINTVVQMRWQTALARYFIAQTETPIQGLGNGLYRGICSFAGEVWFTPGQNIEAVGSWGPVVDDYTSNVTISGILFPRGSVTLG